jgi:hypothetical protein
MIKLDKPVYSDAGLKFYGNRHWIELVYEPDPEEPEGDLVEGFFYRGDFYPLSYFMDANNRVYNPKKPLPMDGYRNDSAFSGVAIQQSDDGDAVRAFLYFGMSLWERENDPQRYDTRIYDCNSNIIRQGSNLRTLLDYIRDEWTWVDGVNLSIEPDENGRYKVVFRLGTGGYAVTWWNSTSVLRDWVKSRRSWGSVSITEV